MVKKHVRINKRVCPWWLLPTFDNPLRRLIHNPDKILTGLLWEGDRVADLGCGMGYFTLPLARLVGETGRVFAVDLQPQMLAGLQHRAQRSGLLPRISLHQATSNSLGLDEPLDFALAFWMVHETSETLDFFQQISALLKPGAALLLVEPLIHVTSAEFQRTIDLACATGLSPLRPLSVALSRAMLLTAPPIPH